MGEEPLQLDAVGGQPAAVWPGDGGLEGALQVAILKQVIEDVRFVLGVKRPVLRQRPAKDARSGPGSTDDEHWVGEGGGETSRPDRHPGGALRGALRGSFRNPTHLKSVKRPAVELMELGGISFVQAALRSVAVLELADPVHLRLQ